ncbi:arylsulfotransferase [Penicillium atrosanguineum]|uniref:Uncharacterized protein n=1 Tax=Penicillium atrosanguineum TaxID=1132637 RepID=A0A9W9PX87_9EURO|nr:arylsulfotransferase [Penicillium atrosanguineum]KAJ5310420.1 arylsulfotransferase [Penicillium atrosanguineum]KAJ5315940.1 hypothetical protein N7476_006247 [Penicillium atrosanguineum]
MSLFLNMSRGPLRWYLLASTPDVANEAPGKNTSLGSRVHNQGQGQVQGETKKRRGKGKANADSNDLVKALNAAKVADSARPVKVSTKSPAAPVPDSGSDSEDEDSE